MGAVFVLPDGYADVAPTAFPPYDQATQTCVRQTPVFENGAWIEVWEVRDLTPQELAIKFANAAKRQANLIKTN
jgi:hypothetical protein